MNGELYPDVKKFSIVLILLVLAVTVVVLASKPSSPMPFQEQHDALRGVWIRDQVKDADPSFYVRHLFANGRYATTSSIPFKDRGTYRVIEVHPDGTFKIEMTSSRYGFTVTMDIEPIPDDPDHIKLDHQTSRRQ